MPLGYRIVGIAPRELDAQPDPVKLMFWSWVVDLGLKAKDRDLSQGLDAFGDPLRPISLATRKHRKSEMTPSGEGDPSAPPLMPGRKLSRTRSLLAGTAYTDHAAFWWRYDPWTFNSWSRILTFQQARGRDVFGLSPEAVQRVRQQALARWRRWLKAPTVPQVPAPVVSQVILPTGKMGLEHVDFGIGATRGEVEQAAKEGRFSGLRTIEEWKAYFRQPAKVAAMQPARTSFAVRQGEANVLLRHIWGGRGPGGVEPITPKPPGPKPAPKPKSPAPFMPATTLADALKTSKSLGVRIAVETDDIVQVMADQYGKISGFTEDRTREGYVKNWTNNLKGTRADDEIAMHALNGINKAIHEGRAGKIPVMIRKPMSGPDSTEEFLAGRYFDNLHMIGVYDNGDAKLDHVPQPIGGRIHATTGNRFPLTDGPTAYRNEWEGTYTHEFGHHYTMAIKPEIVRRADAILAGVEDKKKLKGLVTNYATKNGQELAAEAYTLRHHPEFQTLSDESKAMIRKVLGE